MSGDSSKRQKRIAIAGAIVLAALLAFQGPRTVKLLRGSSSPASAVATGSLPHPAAASRGSVSPTSARSSNAAARFALKDPFISPPGAAVAPRASAALTATSAGPSLLSGSGVSYDDSRSLAASSGPSLLSGAQAVVSAPVEPAQRPRSSGGGGSASRYTVILSSVRLAAGRRAAERDARRFRRARLPGVRILVSARYRSLRAGYYAVCSGSYTTASAAQRAAAEARSVARGARARPLLLRPGAGT